MKVEYEHITDLQDWELDLLIEHEYTEPQGHIFSYATRQEGSMADVREAAREYYASGYKKPVSTTEDEVRRYQNNKRIGIGSVLADPSKIIPGYTGNEFFFPDKNRDYGRTFSTEDVTVAQYDWKSPYSHDAQQQADEYREFIKKMFLRAKPPHHEG